MALHCSHKSPFEITDADLYGELWKSLQQFRRRLPVALQAAITDAAVAATVQSVVTAQTTARCRPTGPRHECNPSLNTRHRSVVLKTDVMQAKRYLKYAVVSEVDKGAGNLAIM